MAKPPLSMKPTGWFQVAWSDEIDIGDVHTMKYFDQEMIAWRAESGQLTVMNAYCEHLGAHLGLRRHASTAKCCSARFTAGSGTSRDATCASPMRTGPTGAAGSGPIRWSSATSRSTSGTTSRAGTRSSTHPTSSPTSATAAVPTDYYPQQRLFQQGLELHPQYVLENGVDFAHFKYVHDTPIVPVFTRHDFDEPVSYVDFTITFEGDDGQKIEDVSSGVEAINGGLGIAVTKSWGMIDNRTISAITPVDESTSDVRFMVYIGRPPAGSANDPSGPRARPPSSARR